MESPARGRLQFPDAPQPLALEYSRGRTGSAHGEALPSLPSLAEAARACLPSELSPVVRRPPALLAVAQVCVCV